MFLAYLQLIRAPAVFTALSNILAAHLIATQGHIIWVDLLLLMGSSAALYSAGMVLNDWFDYETDLKHRPYRPLPSGKISRRHGLIAGSLLLIIGVILAALVGTTSFVIALGIVLLILVYDGILKRTSTAGFVMGGCRYLNWMLGFSSLALNELSLLIPVTVFLYIFSLTILSQQEETAENKSAVLITAFGISLAGIIIIALAGFHKNALGTDLVLILLGVGWINYYIWKCYQNFNPSSVQKTMSILLLGIIPLDALLVLAFTSWWWFFPVLGLLLPAKLLARRMYIT